MKRILFAALAIISFSTHADQDKSCQSTIGKKNAETLVKWCINVSPATHPPCNSLNSCALITEEIRRGCDMLMTGGLWDTHITSQNAPFYCLITKD